MKVSHQSIADFYKIHQEKLIPSTILRILATAKLGFIRLCLSSMKWETWIANLGQNQFCQSEWALQSSDEVKTCNLC